MKNISGLMNNNVATNMKQAKQTPDNTLGKDAFLEILVAQLKYQDPMEPVKDREFIAQMAQFSGLEQMANLNKSMTQFISGQMQNSLVDKTNLVGKKVQFTDGNGIKHSGEVNAVLSSKGMLLAEIKGENNVTIPIEAIIRVEGGK